MVLVIRVDDLAIAASPGIAPKHTLDLLADRQEEMHAVLAQQRDEARRKLGASRGPGR